MSKNKVEEAPEQKEEIPPSETPTTKSEADRNADARNSIGGQGPAGSHVEEDKERISAETLAGSTHPKAPEHPLEHPKTPLADAFDETPAAETAEAPKE